MRSRSLFRLLATLLTAAALALSGLAVAVAAERPMPPDCPHHAAPQVGALAGAHAGADHAGDATGQDAMHRHGDPAKTGPCQCPLMACSAFTLLPPGPAAPGPAFVAARLAAPARMPVFAGHPPGPPFEPPRA